MQGGCSSFGDREQSAVVSGPANCCQPMNCVYGSFMFAFGLSVVGGGCPLLSVYLLTLPFRNCTRGGTGRAGPGVLFVYMSSLHHRLKTCKSIMGAPGVSQLTSRNDLFFRRCMRIPADKTSQTDVLAKRFPGSGSSLSGRTYQAELSSGPRKRVPRAVFRRLQEGNCCAINVKGVDRCISNYLCNCRTPGARGPRLPCD